MNFNEISLLIVGILLLVIGIYYQNDNRVKKEIIKSNNRRGIKTDQRLLKNATESLKKAYTFAIISGIIIIIISFFIDLL